MTTPDEYASTSDATQFWNQFPADWRPDHPGDTVVGTVDWYGERKVIDGIAPVIRIKTDDGDLVNVVATQTMLLIKLKKLKPRRGDRIKIQFDGIEPSSNPRLKPAHRYLVAVRSGVTEAAPES
jgi:hypothetical protein